MKAILLERHGEPSEILQVRDVPAPTPGRNEVRVRMLLSPINPSDLLVVRGTYGTLPNLPATPGFEGVGVIDAVGPGLLRFIRGLRPGQRVAVPSEQGGNWRELTVRPALKVVPLPDDVPDEQAASFFVNPAAALVMTRRVLNLKPGAWLLQTAAGSALGRMVIRLGQRYGFRTINAVRRREQADELKKLGIEVICTDEERIDERVMEITKGGPAYFMRSTRWAAAPVRPRPVPWPSAAGCWFTACCPANRFRSIRVCSSPVRESSRDFGCRNGLASRARSRC